MPATRSKSLPAWVKAQVSGKRITHAGITIVRIAGGKIAEFWKQDDALGVLRQLGKLGDL